MRVGWPPVIKRDLGGRATHVEGENVGFAEPLGEMGGDRHAGSGTGFDQADRELTGEVEAQCATAGAHHEEGAARAPLLQSFGELGQISRHQRLNVGVGHRGRDAAILADLRQHARGQRHGEIRPLGPDGLCRSLLVGRVGIGVQEAHGDGLHILRPQRAHGLANLGLVEGCQDLPVEPHALGDADAPIARHQGLGEFDEQIMEIVAKFGSGLERIAKAARGEQGRACAFSLDDGVGRQGRAVHDGADGVVTRLGLLEHLRDGRQHCLRRALGRGQHLG